MRLIRLMIFLSPCLWFFTSCDRSGSTDAEHSDNFSLGQPSAMESVKKNKSIFSAAPSKVMKLWLNAILKQDLKKANDFCVIEGDGLNMGALNAICVNGIAQALEKDSEWLERMNGMKPDEERIEGNDAWVIMRYAEYREKWHLVKIKGSWKIKNKE